LRCRWIARKQLRRHIDGRPDHAAVACTRRDRFTGAEIHQDDPAAGFAHYVLRLDVAVHEALDVNRGKRATDVGAD
jgi:hypothetical protein